MDIGVDDFFIEGAAAKVSNHYAALVLLFKKNILRFKIAVNDPQGFHVLEAAHQLNCKAPDQTLLEASVVVHLDKLVEVQTVEVEGHAQMVAEHKVVLNLNDALLILWVILLYQKKKLCLYRCLIVVLFLVFDKLHGDHRLSLVIEALEDLAESTLADLFNDLKSESNLIILRYPVVAVAVIVSVVNDPLSLGRVDLVLVLSEVEYLLELLNLLDLSLSQELWINLGGL